MKLADYMCDFISNFTDHIFVGNGGCVITLLDSIEKHNNLKCIPTQNEQGAAIAAEAYSRVKQNGIGVALATSGPGMLNLMQGIGCAFYDSIPVLYISGAPPLNHLIKDGEKIRQKGFQEMDVVGIVKPITKYAVLLKDPNMIKYELEKLMYNAFEGNQGPVLLDIPDDLQREEVDPKTMKPFVPERKTINRLEIENQMEIMLRMISEAKRPVVIVGGGAKIGRAEGDVIDFLGLTRFPFVSTWSTIDMFPIGHNGRYVGNFGIASNRYGNYTVQNADLIISLGSRLDTHQTGSDPSKFAPDAKKICINIDWHELHKQNGMKTDLAINAHLKPFLYEFNKSVVKTQNIDPWIKRIEEWKEKYPVRLPEYKNELGATNPYVFMDELAKITGKDDIIITDAGATLTWTFQAYRPRTYQKLFSATNHSPMGYAICASIGAQFAAFGERVICITGDGGIHMNIQELETIKYNNLPVKIFLINNGEYGIIKQTQDTWMNSRYVAVCPKSGVGFPSWSKIATAYGIPYTCIDGSSDEDMKMKMQMVLESVGPMICDVKVKSREQILPKLVFGKPIEDMGPLIDRKEHEYNMKN